jgi:hypothetical protein
MKTVWQWLERVLRGPRVSGWLKRCGIEPVRYWLLLDLFGELSERRELFSQLGRDGMSLRKASWMYYILSGLIVIPFILMDMPPFRFLAIFLAITAFLLLTMLLAETSNSLVNPVEGLVLAHQPIDGATYTAAKLTHLLRILLYLVPGLNAIPAFAGLFLKGCPWYYPLLHMAAAFALGIVLALSCCALFGWLIRFVAPARLKAVGFAAEMSPWLLYVFSQFSRQIVAKIHAPRWLPTHGAPLHMTLAIFGLLAIAAVVLGLRALSGDYLSRVAAIAHGGSGRKSRIRRSRLGDLVDQLCGGPPARAGFVYVSCMMRRDWQFRRQLIGLIPMAIMPLAAAARGIGPSPFSGKFTFLHLFPHAFGMAFYIICSVMIFGNDHKGAWLFLLAPARAFGGFARGVYARLFAIMAVPHLIVWVALVWYWGLRDATLFIAYSMAVAAVYLGLELRLIEGMPFSKQPETTSNPFILGILLLGGMAMAAAVGLQYFVIFRSPLLVAAVTAGLCAAAWLVARSSLDAFEVAMRFHLGMLSAESKGIYKEVDM